jgi:DNA-directed RNA polymerase subunit RPC12/RpoP
VSFLSGGSWTSDPRESAGDSGIVRKRRSTRSDRLAEATIACVGCDAPVAIGPGPRSLTDELSCPYCGRRGPIRDFLSLTRPTRPTRVVLRISLGERRA